MLQSNNHLWEDAQIIDITPLPTNIARTPVAHEDSRLLGSQPNSPLDRSQFQLAPKQSQVEQQFVFTQRQPWVYLYTQRPRPPLPLPAQSHRCPSVQPPFEVHTTPFFSFLLLLLVVTTLSFPFLSFLSLSPSPSASPAFPLPPLVHGAMSSGWREKGGRTPLAELAFRGFRYLNPIFFRVARRPCTLLWGYAAYKAGGWPSQMV